MKKILFFICLTAFFQIGYAKNPPAQERPASSDNSVDFRADCQPGTNSVDLNVNNVRARLLSRGDFWWDYNEAKYIVPNVAPGSGVEEVSSIFAGAVWMGGFDDSNNLKLAATDYANNGETDFYPGPLDVASGTTDAPICIEWDRHFSVLGANIDAFKAKFAAGLVLGEADIPEDLKFYPARGNPYFATQSNGFILPNQDLGSFFDNNEDQKYDPLDGDYPVIQIRGCPDTNYADQIYFQIYNDNGGPHTITGGNAIRMEVQVQAFGFATTDELNDMTFMRYKLLNRATDTIKDCYFAMWVDADLGCSDDDYVGCDTTRSLAFYYNADDVDGAADGTCGNATTYKNNIPMIGIDYFRGPIDENGNELGMSSFTYINRASTDPAPPGGTTDPNENVNEYYNYLTGKWRDGTPFYGGDDGYQDPQFPVIQYAFPGKPNDPSGWSMAQEGLIPGDRRTVQASGPFKLKPGKTNELIIGLPWVPNVKHPVPDISRLLAADDKAQILFDNCFDLMDGPDAPDMDIIELDREIVITLGNNLLSNSNNKKEKYKEMDDSHEGEFYEFEGYQIFQTISPNVSLANIDDISVARIVAQTDVKNGVTTLYNWEDGAVNPDPANPIQLFIPVLKASEVDTTMDTGIRHSFSFTRNEFASGGEKLINHRKYYYVAIAYAYNNYLTFDPNNPSLGQKRTYLTGRKNAYGSKIIPVTVIPRPSTYSQLSAKYGEGPVITRISGGGTSSNFLKISDEERAHLLENNDGTVQYLPGMAPIQVKVVNPLEVNGGKFRLKVTDQSGNAAPHTLEGEELNWMIEEFDDAGGVVNTIVSERSLDYFNEQIIKEYGISVQLNQVKPPGAPEAYNYGAVGMEVAYKDSNGDKWLTTIQDAAPITDFIDNVDPTSKAFATSVDPVVAFYPFTLTNSASSGASSPYFITPGWVNSKAGQMKNLNDLSHLNNVDIVFTADKSKWSRCIVVEAASSVYGKAGVSTEQIKTEGDKEQFRLRDAASVGKDVDENGNAKADGDGKGMGWFPGYAIDVETGNRLNIFFGENSTYRNGTNYYPNLEGFGEKGLTGGDMMFNPSGVPLVDLGTVTGSFLPNANSVYLGGQHFVYVTYGEYDGCAHLRQSIDEAPNSAGMTIPLSRIQWAGLPIPAPGSELLSYKEGLIPNEVVVSLRAAIPYNTAEAFDFNYTNFTLETTFGANPVYEFDLGSLKPTPIVEGGSVETALDEISVVPNPYYGFSQYETDQFTTTVKITNLPAKCTVKIFSLDGKFIRKFDRDEEPSIDPTSKITRQITPAIEWNLKNASDIPIASGVYLIYVEAPGIGERVIKWFGMNRQFDASGL